jgi:hypothetical protein
VDQVFVPIPVTVTLLPDDVSFSPIVPEALVTNPPSAILRTFQLPADPTTILLLRLSEEDERLYEGAKLRLKPEPVLLRSNRVPSTVMLFEFASICFPSTTLSPKRTPADVIAKELPLPAVPTVKSPKLFQTDELITTLLFLAEAATPTYPLEDVTNPPLDTMRLLPLASLPTVKSPALFQVEGTETICWLYKMEIPPLL